MIGAIFGDIVGPVHEHTRKKNMRFALFTEGSRFLETDGLTSGVKTAISLGGDADTQAAIAGAAASAFAGGMSEALRMKVRERLPADMLEVLDAFEARYGC
ncbi:hypothetical protein BH11GEM2_BH11GEM2_41130 [soil metagenome]